MPTFLISETLKTRKMLLTVGLAHINAEFQQFDKNMENVLLEAISQKRWWFIQDKQEIIYDSHTGWIWPNFEHVSLYDAEIRKWSYNSERFCPAGITGWTADYVSVDDMLTKVRDIPNIISLAYKYVLHSMLFLNEQSNVCITLDELLLPQAPIWISIPASQQEIYHFVLPYNTKYYNHDLAPQCQKYTRCEKAKIVLDFFNRQGWVPQFAHPEHQKIFEACNKFPQLQAQLIDLEKQVAELPSSEIKTPFTSNFDYTQPLRDYNLTIANRSVWQYSVLAQRWLNELLNHLDDWTQNNAALLAYAQKVNNSLAQKLPLGQTLNEDEKTLFNHRRQLLQTQLNFNLDALRATLISFHQQAVNLEKDLTGVNSQADSLNCLAQVAQQPRPPFELLAEHTATLCTKTLKKLEWLGVYQAFVEQIVEAEKIRAEQYTVFIDKYKADLYTHANESGIENVEVDKWFAEWRRERQQIENQWLPLVQAGLNQTLNTSTIMAVLTCLSVYQQQLDNFYLHKRQGIHINLAFATNAHGQEKLEKELEFAKLTHHFMEQLQRHIFASQRSSERVYLVRWAEIWQQDSSQELLHFFGNEQLIEFSETLQISLSELRKIKQSNLESYLQDVKAYSEALKKREENYKSLVFKMRKELEKRSK